MPSLGACSFGGVAFSILIPDGFAPLPTREVIDSETVIPYGDVVIIDHGGLGAWKLAAEVKILPANKVAFENLNGQEATLVLYGTSVGTGKLRIQPGSARVLFDASEYRYTIELVY